MAVSLSEAPSDIVASSRPKLRRNLLVVLVIAVITPFLVYLASPAGQEIESCVQPDKYSPDQSTISSASLFINEKYRSKSAKLLSGAVKIPTESYDDMNNDPLTEPRFEVFKELHSYLNSSFPHVSQSVEYVNTYGLLYTIQGRDTSLEPVVLMAHQDVVPVNPETVGEWTHPPFSGFIDSEFVWGRGSLDTKNSLIAILEAAEALVTLQWHPERTVLISFGFDEELDGSRGAKHLASTIKGRYGSDGVYMIIDEGSAIAEQYGSLFAAPGVAEKGYTDITAVVQTPGGHSSLPPDHTGIGIISELVKQLEHPDNSFEPHLSKGSVVSNTFKCVAKYGQDIDDDDKALWSNIDSRWALDKLASILGSSRSLRGTVQTTQAVDIIVGGVKINALPEEVSLMVNYRIDIDSSVDKVTSRFVELARAVSERHDLGLVVNNKALRPSHAKGTLIVSNGQSLEPSPVSPFTVEDKGWALLGEITRYVFEDIYDYDRVYMTPMLETGNTDTVHYWDLTSRIYRYVPMIARGDGAHTVDEYTSIDAHVQAVVWYFEFLQSI